MDKARQFIKDYTRGCSNELCAVEDIHGKKVISYHEWLTPEQALAAVEIEKEELIDKGCMFFSNLPHYFYDNGNGNVFVDYVGLITDFKKALGK